MDCLDITPDEGGGESESGGGFDEEPSSGGSSLDDEDEDDEPELCAAPDSSGSDSEELPLNWESFLASITAESAELSTEAEVADAFAASEL